MEELNFEDALKKLEAIVASLERGDVAIEEAYTLFEQGVALVKHCEDRLKNIENKVNKIIENGKEEDLRIEDSEE